MQRAGLNGNHRGPFPILTSIFLVTGTMVGVGMLAVPVFLGLAGFQPGLVSLLGTALLVWTAGYALAERVMDYRNERLDLSALFQADLGVCVRWLIIPIYLLLFYALLTAYLVGAAQTLAELMPIHPFPVLVWLLIAFFCASLVFLFGQLVLLRWNGVLVTAMLIAFAILLMVSARHMEAIRLASHRWSVLPLTIPPLCCAFAYHNVIPLVCRAQQWGRLRVHGVLSAGLALALLMTTAWFTVVAGSLPLTDPAGGPSLSEAYGQGYPATVPLARLLQSPAITISGLVFSLLAILTSYIGVGAALCSFLRDAAPFFCAPRRAGWLFAVVFLPPLAFALCEPGIFLDMIELIGGVGMILLFGILPLLAFLRHRAAGRPLLQAAIALPLALFLVILIVELGKVSGIVQFDPNRGCVFKTILEKEAGHTMGWWLGLQN